MLINKKTICYNQAFTHALLVWKRQLRKPKILMKKRCHDRKKERIRFSLKKHKKHRRRRSKMRLDEKRVKVLSKGWGYQVQSTRNKTWTISRAEFTRRLISSFHDQWRYVLGMADSKAEVRWFLFVDSDLKDATIGKWSGWLDC